MLFEDHCLAEVILSCTTENREVSSSKSFTVDAKSSGRPLMLIRKKSGARLESCSTLALSTLVVHW